VSFVVLSVLCAPSATKNTKIHKEHEDINNMQESKRQKQVSGLIQEYINEIFQRMSLNMINGGMVSISSVKVTPDLLEARIYLSFFQVKDAKATMKKIEDKAWEIKKQLSARIGKQLRRIPEIKYFKDDTLDHVFKMEELFRQIGKDKPESEEGARGEEEQ
jgi:ribosome-binding factor A